MGFVLSVALVVAGIVGLGLVVVRVVRLLRAARGAASMMSASMRDHVGLVRARSAALRVAFAQRRRRLPAPGSVRSTVNE